MSTMVIFLFLLLAASSSSYAITESRSDEVKAVYEWWLTKHGKTYGGLEENDKRAALIGINRIVIGELISLSEQELEDCDKTYNLGWNGGLVDYAFDFIIDNGGIDTEDDYPYKGLDGICNPSRVQECQGCIVSMDGYEDVLPYSEKALENQWRINLLALQLKPLADHYNFIYQ
ncbi:hypothetical protein ACH5RR_014036 [Cinchona calisaya]|uniref:Peptidase C1A papain C-terminal domain-containing protein n=1 Tax=Cinchona calisaya TaxID=153742 RepID=A0ABD3A355_9GENT